jgi:elongation factor G
MSRMQDLQNTRNIGIVAHVDAGKTTTTEQILYFAGRTHKQGDVDDGNTVTDHMDLEREKGITIVSAAVTFQHDGRKVNLIDTPGHIDFTMEVERSMRVLDSVVLVLCANGRVQPQTNTVYAQAQHHEVPLMIFVNKMDTTGADFEKAVAEIKTVLKAHPAVIVIPIGKESGFEGLIDVIAMKALYWDEGDATGAHFDVREIPADQLDRAQAYRAELVAALADADEAVGDLWLNELPISADDLQAGLRRATIARKLVPVLSGSAKRRRGVQQLMDAVNSYLPSPLDVGAVKGHTLQGQPVSLQCSDEEPLSALVFKVVSDQHGFLYYVRVYSGVLTAGTNVLNSTSGKKERISRLVRMQGNKREDVEELRAGDIGVCLALKSSATGDTLCDANHAIRLEKIIAPVPVFSRAVEPLSSGDSQHLSQALARLASEDPSFRFGTDPETGQIVISGQGELHLEIMIARMEREDKVTVHVGKPTVAYREGIRGTAHGIGDFKRQNGGRGMYGYAEIDLAPLDPANDLEDGDDTNFKFVDEVVGGTIPREFIPSVRKGIEQALHNGPLTGSPVIGVKATLTFGKYHDVDSNDMAFQLAGQLAFKDAFLAADPVLLEPIMLVTIQVPDGHMGIVIGDLGRRRGRVVSTEISDGKCKIVAHVPASESFGYSAALRNATQGQLGLFSLSFAQYEPLPDNRAQAIIAERKAAREAK